MSGSDSDSSTEARNESSSTKDTRESPPGSIWVNYYQNLLKDNNSTNSTGGDVEVQDYSRESAEAEAIDGHETLERPDSRTEAEENKSSDYIDSPMGGDNSNNQGSDENSHPHQGSSLGPEKSPQTCEGDVQMKSASTLLSHLIVNNMKTASLQHELAATERASVTFRPPKKTIKHLKKKVEFLTDQMKGGLQSYETLSSEVSKIKEQLPSLATLDSKIEALNQRIADLHTDVNSMEKYIPVIKALELEVNRVHQDSEMSRKNDFVAFESAAANSTGSSASCSSSSRKPSASVPVPSTSTEGRQQQKKSLSAQGASKFHSSETNTKTIDSRVGKPGKRTLTIVPDTKTKTRSQKRKNKASGKTSSDEEDSMNDFQISKRRNTATKHAPRTPTHQKLLKKITRSSRANLDPDEG